MVGPPEVLVDGLVFPECPRWRDGRLWFSDVLGGTVHTVDLDGRLETVADVPGRPGGLGWSAAGDLLVVSTTERRLVDVDGTTVADLAPVAPSNPNDMVTDADGTAYVSNNGFAFTEGADWAPAQVLRVRPDGEPSVAADDLNVTNGLVITADNRLVVAESWGRRLTSFAIEHDGALADRRTVATFEEGWLPDGIALDPDGAIWMADPIGRRCVRLVDGVVTQQIDHDRRIYAPEVGAGLLFLCTGTTVRPERALAERAGAIEVVAL